MAFCGKVFYSNIDGKNQIVTNSGANTKSGQVKPKANNEIIFGSNTVALQDFWEEGWNEDTVALQDFGDEGWNEDPKPPILPPHPGPTVQAYA